MIPVRLDDSQARIGALTLPLERIRLRLLWRADENSKEAPIGHAYALDAGDGVVEIVTLEHGVIDQQGMLALLKTVDRRLNADEERTWTPWRSPADTKSLSCDLGALGELLRDRRLHVLDAATGRAPTTRCLPQEAFLRAPVATWARHLLGITWPERWEAQILRGSFLAARRGERLVFTGCRYGSIHADSGQDRTAAVFLSEDGARSWTDLPWRLSERQARSSSGRWCWPPEELLSVRLEPDLVVEWDDPWIVWDPGNEWRATWDGEIWHMAKRSGMGAWPRNRGGSKH